MALIVETPRCSYVGDGSTSVFATTFTFGSPNDVTVWRGAPSVVDCCEAPTYENLLVPNVDYVWQAGDYAAAGGSIQVLAGSVIADGELVTLMRTTPPDQPQVFGNEQEFTPRQLEGLADRMTRMIQELYHNPFGVFLLGGLAHEWNQYIPDAWDDQTALGIFNIRRGIKYRGAFLGSAATVETYDAAEKVISIRDEADAEVGTLTIPAASGNLLFATTAPGGFTKTLDDQLRLVPPSGGLGDVTGLAWTIVGEVT